MTGFCRRLLLMSAGALVFGGASFAQNITSCSDPASAGGQTSLQATVPGPLNLRAEGTTELTGDVLFSCLNGSGAPTATGAVSEFLSAPVTSKVVTAATGATEATLFICTTLAACATNPMPNPLPAGVTSYQGTINGSQVSFVNVSFPAANFFFGRISNVRVNANAVTLSTTLTTVTAQVLASANNTSGNTSSTTVGYVFNSLNPTKVLPPTGSLTIPGYTTCAGNPIGPVAPPALSMLVPIGEVFGGAFKAQNPIAADSTPGEAGSYIPGGNAVGTASFGTRLQLTFGNVSTGMTIFVPTTINVTLPNAAPPPATLPVVTLALTSSASGAFSAVAASTNPKAPVAGGLQLNATTGLAETYGASAAFTPTNGTVTAVYEVQDAPAANIISAQVPVWVGFAANAFTTAQGPITVTTSYAPISAAASATTVPNFAAAGTPVNATTVTVCQTNLLFPFVSSSQGFDTGIVLADTSTDIYGTAPAGGTCTLNFYGTGAPSPATGVAAPGGTQASGTVNTFLLSSVAPGFTGYVIAQCNYQFGYGYAFIENGLGTASGVAEGYIAPNLQRPGGNSIIGQ